MFAVGGVLKISDDLAAGSDADHAGVGRTGRIKRRRYAIVDHETMDVAKLIGNRSGNFAGGADSADGSAGGAGNVDRRKVAVIVNIDVFLANSTTVDGVNNAGEIFGSYADSSNTVREDTVLLDESVLLVPIVDIVAENLAAAGVIPTTSV
jgi:hypothetical protein